MTTQTQKHPFKPLLPLLLGIILGTLFLVTTASKGYALEQMDNKQMRNIVAQEGILIGLNMELGAPGGATGTNALRLEIEDDGGIPPDEGGTGTAGVFQLLFEGNDTLKISANGGLEPAQFGINFDSDEGIVIDAKDVQLDMQLSDVFLGTSIGSAPGGSANNSMGRLILNDLEIDDSFVKAKIK